ncbi:hypothetical protein G6F31_017874 [Rhizopus arrhizus]|nr:hypothetical protein G6F31_017874 [Rhizopus arrhizus]
MNSSPVDVSVDTAYRIIGIDGGMITPTVPDHGRDQDRAHGERRGHAGTGNRREDHAGQDAGAGQAALDATDHALGEFDHAFGNAAGFHQVAGQDKKRHGQQWERLHARDHALRDHHVRHAARDQNEQQRRARHGHRHRQAQDHQQQKGSNQCAHVLLLERHCGFAAGFSRIE